jgi:hypothetical protein
VLSVVLAAAGLMAHYWIGTMGHTVPYFT